MIADAILATGSVFFDLALVPSIVSEQKPARLTCALTALWLAVFAAVYVSLGLGFAAATTLVGTAEWAVLLAQPRWARG